MTTSPKHIIGRTELVDLPEWDFQQLAAKIDTGAYTSSLHCHHMEAFEKQGKKWIRFYLLDPDHEAYNDQMLEMPLIDQRKVKSSNGEIELRFFVQTTIRLFGEIFPIELSLTDRSSMKYPLLIGRKFLKRRSFLVDVSKQNLSNTEEQQGSKNP